MDGTAKGNGKDYSDVSGFVEFLDDQTEYVVYFAFYSSMFDAKSFTNV